MKYPMKKTALFKIWGIIIPLMAISCKEDLPPVIQEPPVSHSDMLICHHTIVWDSITTRNALIGKWQWEYITCYGNPEEANYDDYKDMFVEFKADNTLEVKMNEQITQTVTWDLKSGEANVWIMKVEPLVPQIVGRIILCGDRVEFQDSYTDGCDNYFKRK
ncbi:MAG: hypothetical protein SF052_14885 [Bacteroidia bacterium]|nr:hypothetical protein [Bacteroidia bacterium]